MSVRGTLRQSNRFAMTSLLSALLLLGLTGDSIFDAIYVLYKSILETACNSLDNMGNLNPVLQYVDSCSAGWSQNILAGKYILRCSGLVLNGSSVERLNCVG